VKAATGEIVDAETLGGGSVHSRISGVTDHLADDDAHALAITREIVAHLNVRKENPLAMRAPVDPEYPVEDIYGIVSREYRFPYDIREIIARIVDGSEFHEFKKLYGSTLVCGFAHLDGFPIGVIANNGILFMESAQKGAHFIQLCNRRGIPLLFLQNITGFMVGKRVEHAGIAKEGAKMVNAVATALVRRRKLCDVWQGIQPPHAVDVAERANLRHGWGAGGAGPVDRKTRRPRGTRRGMVAGRADRIRKQHS
jgi:3-methylcrotonyl-CoA carboxylase beta subunit